MKPAAPETPPKETRKERAWRKKVEAVQAGRAGTWFNDLSGAKDSYVTDAYSEGTDSYKIYVDKREDGRWQFWAEEHEPRELIIMGDQAPEGYATLDEAQYAAEQFGKSFEESAKESDAELARTSPFVEPTPTPAPEAPPAKKTKRPKKTKPEDLLKLDVEQVDSYLQPMISEAKTARELDAIVNKVRPLGDDYPKQFNRIFKAVEKAKADLFRNKYRR